MNNEGLKYVIVIPPDLVKAIGDYLVEQLKPIIDNNQDTEDELLDVAEVAAFMKTSKNQIYQWTNQSQHGLNTFPYYKSGKLLRFSKKEIMQWLKSNGKR
jgi:excisionase family DNA binding protein